MRYFKTSLIITILGIVAAFFWGGTRAVILTLLLSILEISLSFDNAVLNSTVLKRMDKKWQVRFLTWGILISVFLVRFLLPVLIVSILTHLGVQEVIKLAIINPTQYSQHLLNAKASISAFGGMFLFMVFLSFIFDPTREVHWLGKIEKKLAEIGKLSSIKIIVGLLVLIYVQKFATESERLEVIIAGTIGIILFALLNSLTAFLNRSGIESKHNGILQFLYLEILDASFSLDGVISAFAITKDIVVILIGLTIGAIFVRSITIFLVNKKTIQRYLYLEHGAHYAIGALALIMLASLSIEVSEVLTGLIGVSFIALALLTSLQYNRNQSSNS